MTITTMQIEGTDRVPRDVPLDALENYDVPVWKLGHGAEGEDPRLVSDDDPLPVTLADQPLPEGAATAARQDSSNQILTAIASYLDTEVAAILAKLAAGLPAALGAGGGIKIDGSGAAVQVSAASLPLPTGAATSVLQGAGLPAALGAGGGLKVEGFSGAYPFVTQPYSLAVARGLITGVGQINKFGAAPSGVQTTSTDIWSRADAVPTQQIWLAPTAARVHAIVSTSASDDGDPVGVGARTIRIYGLTSWDTAETSEVVTLNGLGAVNTANAYVIIHRMKVLTCGASGPNVGTISATAANDGTVTAVILPGDGQTEMAIYGVPSTQTLILTRWGVGIDKASPTATTCDFELRVNENPNVQLLAFLRKDDMAVQSTGNQWQERTYGNPVPFSGPCIIKVQGIASSADTDAKSGFDGYLVTK